MVLFTFCVLVHAAFYVLACNCWEPFLRETFIPKEQEQATSVFLHEPRETVQMSVMHLSNWWLRNYSQYWWPATFAKSGWSLLIQQLLWHFSFLCCCICNSLSLTHIHAFILCTSLFTFICLCVIEQIVEDLKESPLLSCFCSAFPSLQIRPRSLWFQTNNSWPDLLTTWLFLRTDKHSILSHPLPHLTQILSFMEEKSLVSRTLHTHSSVLLSDGAAIFLFSCSASWTHQPQWYRTISKWLYLYKLYICFEIRHCCQYCKLLFFSINTSLYAYIAQAICAVLMVQFKIWSLCNFGPTKTMVRAG